MEIIIYALTTGFLLTYIAYTNKQNVKEREKLIKAILAKNLQDLTDNEIINKEPDDSALEETQPEAVSESDLPDKQFYELIQEQLKNARKK